MRKDFWKEVARRLKGTVPVAVAAVFLAQVIVSGWYGVNWMLAVHTGVWAAALTVAETLITFEPEETGTPVPVAVPEQQVFDQERI